MTQSNNTNSIIIGNCKNLLRQDLEVTQNTKKDFKQQRTTIHFKIFERIVKSVKDKENTIYGISFST